MMEVGSYTFHRRAAAVFNPLAGDEQAQVLETLAALLGTAVAQWPAAQVKRLPRDQSLYLVHVNDSLRALVQVVAGQEPEVMDLVHHETLECFAKAAANNGE
jgi:hypothetical protein